MASVLKTEKKNPNKNQTIQQHSRKTTGKLLLMGETQVKWIKIWLAALQVVSYMKSYEECF